MKPARGSKRASSEAPIPRKKRKIKQSAEDEGRSEKTTDAKPHQRKKAERGPAVASKKMKVGFSWKEMPSSSITAVESIMNLSILATLALRHTEKKASQEHLNIIKNRFLARCAQLRVPAQKQNDPVRSSLQRQEETRKSAAVKKTLSSLEGDLKAVVRALEVTEEKMASLEQTCSVLRDELEEEEEKAKQILDLPDQAVLRLPPVPPHREETFESRLRAMVPDSERQDVARELGAALQNPEDARELLLRAHKHADLLLNPPSSAEPDPEYNTNVFGLE